MGGTKYWTWHMAAGVLILFLLGMHMLIMHAALLPRFSPYSTGTDMVKNTLLRDGKLFFTVTYILMLGLGLYHGLYGLRTMLFELTLNSMTEKAVTFVLVIVGVGLFGLGTWAAVIAHSIALAGARG